MSAHIPPKFRCPLTKELFQDPVISCDGITYERLAIEAHFNAGNDTNPITGQKLDNLTLVPDTALKAQIEDYYSSLQSDRQPDTLEKETIEDVKLVFHDILKSPTETKPILMSMGSCMSVETDAVEDKDMAEALKPTYSFDLKLNKPESIHVPIENKESKKEGLKKSFHNEQPSFENPKLFTFRIAPSPKNKSPPTKIHSEADFYPGAKDKAAPKLYNCKNLVSKISAFLSLAFLHIVHLCFLQDYLNLENQGIKAARDRSLWGMDIVGIGFMCFLGFELFLLLARNRLKVRRDFILEKMMNVGFCIYPLIELIMIVVFWEIPLREVDLPESLSDIRILTIYCLVSNTISFLVFLVKSLARSDRVSAFVSKIVRRT